MSTTKENGLKELETWTVRTTRTSQRIICPRTRGSRLVLIGKNGEGMTLEEDGYDVSATTRPKKLDDAAGGEDETLPSSVDFHLEVLVHIS